MFTDKEKQGGGPLIDIGVHMLDLALFFMGHPKPTSASGMAVAKIGNTPGHVGASVPGTGKTTPSRITPPPSCDWTMDRLWWWSRVSRPT